LLLSATAWSMPYEGNPNEGQEVGNNKKS